MKETHFFYVPEAENNNRLPEEEAKHALRVLRLKPDDDIYLISGNGFFHHAKVTATSSKFCEYRLVESFPQQRIWNGHIHIALAPTKNMDRVEWMVEKATEVGVDEFSFLDCRFSERRVIKNERVEKIVISAVKQSRKAWVPVVNEMMPYSLFLQKPQAGLKVIAHCYEEIPREDLFSILQQPGMNLLEGITILIGPEGDFSVDEVRAAINNGYRSVSLGKCRLRTETAALAAVMMAQLSFRIV